MNIRLPVERHRRLRRVAFDLEVSMNDIINDAIESHLSLLELRGKQALREARAVNREIAAELRGGKS